MEPDPRFPNRPTHEDFDDLSKAVIENDMEAGAGRLLERIAEFVDYESLVYMMMQRAGSNAVTIGGMPSDVPRLAAAMVDGFILGCAYSRRRYQ